MRVLYFSAVLILSSVLFSQIDSVRYWAGQLQGLDEPGAVDSLANSYYDMLVLEPTRTDVDCEDFDTRAMVELLHSTSGTVLSRKLIIAYIDIGEAEEWRIYWEDWWEAPTETTLGNPDFMLTTDPDGWSGNYPVAFWDERWQNIIVDDDSSMLKMAIADGFDGIYMDWVEAYDDSVVIAVAETAGISTDSAMIAFIQHIRDVARSINPDFLVIAQNAADLCDDHPEYFGIIDGIAQEDFNFYGEADVPWGDPAAGDIPQDEDYHNYLMGKLNQYLENDVPVFTVEYALIPENIDFAYTYDIALGYIPFVTQTPLSRLPDYYPPGYDIAEKNDLKPEFSIRASPNPFNLSVKINLISGRIRFKYPVNARIYTLSGDVVAKTQMNITSDNNAEFIWHPDENINSGIYIVEIRNNCDIFSRKKIFYLK